MLGTKANLRVTEYYEDKYYQFSVGQRPQIREVRTVKTVLFYFSLKYTTRLNSLNVLHVSKTWSSLSVKHLKIDMHEEGFKHLKRLEKGLPRFRAFALAPSVSLFVLSLSPYSWWVKEKLITVVFFKALLSPQSVLTPWEENKSAQ